jgi:hypothetical protein
VIYKIEPTRFAVSALTFARCDTTRLISALCIPL